MGIGRLPIARLPPLLKDAYEHAGAPGTGGTCCSQHAVCQHRSRGRPRVGSASGKAHGIPLSHFFVRKSPPISRSFPICSLCTTQKARPRKHIRRHRRRTYVHPWCTELLWPHLVHSPPLDRSSSHPHSQRPNHRMRAELLSMRISLDLSGSSDSTSKLSLTV